MSISTPTISEIMISLPNDLQDDLNAGKNKLKPENDLNEDGSLVTDREISSECVSLETEVLKIKEITDSLALSAKEKLKNHKRIKHKYSSQSLGALDILAIKKVQKSEKSNEATQELDVFTKSKGDYSPIDVEELIKSNSELSCILADMQGQLKGLQEKYERQNKSLEKIQEAYTGYCKERDLSVRLEDKGKSSVCSCEII